MLKYSRRWRKPNENPKQKNQKNLSYCRRQAGSHHQLPKAKLVRPGALQTRRKGKETEIHTAVHMLPRRERNKNQASSVQSGISGKMKIKILFLFFS